MIRLEVFGESEPMQAVATLLDGYPDVSRVRVTETVRPGRAVVQATVHPQAVDTLMDHIRGIGVADADVTLTREEVLGPSGGSRTEAGLVWEDVLGMAGRNSRPVARYLVFMLTAGVVACYGVVEYNVILIVGAMAISPDLLPITAIGVGLVDRRARLAGRAFGTLAVGMGFAASAAAVSAFLQQHLGRLPSGFDIDSTVLGALTEVNSETVVVALAAGVAGMLALETRAGSGVGVAVSVTTIPAAAYLGVAIGIGEPGHAPAALAVLAVNVLMMVVSSSGTLLFQRRVSARDNTRRSRRVRPTGS